MSDSFESTRLDVVADCQAAATAAVAACTEQEQCRALECREDANAWSRRRILITSLVGFFGLAICVVGAFTVANEMELDADPDDASNGISASVDATSVAVASTRRLDDAVDAEMGSSGAASAPAEAAPSLESAWPGQKVTPDAECKTPKPGDDCHTAVMWSMMDGVWSKPEWYEGLNTNSSFDAFQDFMHKGGRASCAPSCIKVASEPTASSIDIRRRRRQADMAFCRRRDTGVLHESPGWHCVGGNVVPAPVVPAVPLPHGPYINHYEGNNPMQITPATRRSDNYFLILGDWGKAFGVGDCQRKVAEKMKAYVKRRKEMGKTLLAVTSVGDNFYWSGATPDKWDSQWEDAYGSGKDVNSPLYQIPWISNFGNHDYGDDDPYALCPHVKPLHHIDGQAYASQQFNSDRNPTRPAWTNAYWLPDYNFHYAIPEADLEFISIDTSSYYVGEYRGGHAAGFRDANALCGGWHVAKHHLHRIRESGKHLLMHRARHTKASTVVIIQHYPDSCHREEFMEHLPADLHGKVQVICAWGHDHEQKCFGKNGHGQCNEVLTGGGGGCCGSWGSRGFTAVHLTDDGSYTLDMDSDEVRLPDQSCRN